MRCLACARLEASETVCELGAAARILSAHAGAQGVWEAARAERAESPGRPRMLARACLLGCPGRHPAVLRHPRE